MAVGPKNGIIAFLCIIVVLLIYQLSNQLPHENHRLLQKKEPKDYTRNMLILYNRIPKTGSTSFMSVVYRLCLPNKFNAAFVNVSSSSHRFLFLDQYRFALNITHWVKRKPAVFHGHFPFVNFIPLGLKQPIYINILREPLERFVSHYYFIRYGDTYLPKKKRKEQGDKRTVDECVEQKAKACHPNKIWVQIPYFCGSDPECWKPGNPIALERAKKNLVQYYFLVGTTNRMDFFVELLEHAFPSFFTGASKLFNKDGGVHIRKTKVKKPLKKKTIQFFKSTKVWQLENEFYEFVKDRFDYIYQSYSQSKWQFSYVKVKPD